MHSTRYTKWLTPLALSGAVFAAAVYLFVVAVGGAPVWGPVWFAAAALMYLFLPGLLLAKASGLEKKYPQMGVLLPLFLGNGLFVFLYALSMRLHFLWLLRLLPLFLSTAARWLFRNEFSSLKQRTKTWLASPGNLLLLLLWSILLILFTFTYAAKNAHPLAVGDVLMNQDLLWNAGNAESFAIRFIPEDIRFSGVQLRYHYLTELLAGGLAIVTGLSAYDILAFFFGPVQLAALVAALYRLGIFFYEGEEGARRRKALVFTGAVFLFGCASLWKVFLTGKSLFWNNSVYHLVANVNSQGTATLFFAVFCGFLFLLFDKNRQIDFVDVAMLTLSFLMLAFAKGPVAAIAVCGVALAVLWRVAWRKSSPKLLLPAVLLGVLFFFVYTRFFSAGANTSMVFSATGTLGKTWFAPYLQRIWDKNIYLWYAAIPLFMALHTFCMAPAQGFLYLLGLGKDLLHLPSLSGKRLFLHSQVFGGALAFYLFNHYAMSQLYFVFLALLCMTLLAVDQVDKLSAKPVKAAAIAFGAVGLVTTAFLFVNFVGSGARQLGRNTSVIPKYPYETVMNQDDEAAAAWLRAHTDPQTALFATNRIHTGRAAEGLSNLYSGLSGRQGYMEGFKYALTNMGVPEAVIAERLALNGALFTAGTSPEELWRLTQQAGITHLLYSTQFPGEESQLAVFEKVYDSPTVRIYATGAAPYQRHTLYLKDQVVVEKAYS